MRKMFLAVIPLSLVVFLAAVPGMAAEHSAQSYDGLYLQPAVEIHFAGLLMSGPMMTVKGAGGSHLAVPVFGMGFWLGAARHDRFLVGGAAVTFVLIRQHSMSFDDATAGWGLTLSPVALRISGFGDNGIYLKPTYTFIRPGGEPSQYRPRGAIGIQFCIVG